MGAIEQITPQPDTLAMAKDALAKVSAGFDPNFDRSDDYSFVVAQRSKWARISPLRDSVQALESMDRGGIDQAHLSSWIKGECGVGRFTPGAALTEWVTAEDLISKTVPQLLALAFDQAQPHRTRTAAIDAIDAKYRADLESRVRSACAAAA